MNVSLEASSVHQHEIPLALGTAVKHHHLVLHRCSRLWHVFNSEDLKGERQFTQGSRRVAFANWCSALTCNKVCVVTKGAKDRKGKTRRNFQSRIVRICKKCLYSAQQVCPIWRICSAAEPWFYGGAYNKKKDQMWVKKRYAKKKHRAKNNKLKKASWAACLEFFNYQPWKWKDNLFACVPKASAEVLSDCVSVATSFHTSMFFVFPKADQIGKRLLLRKPERCSLGFRVSSSTVKPSNVIFGTRTRWTKVQMLVIYNR